MILKEKSMMIVLSSPSGAGKTTLARKLQKNNSNFHISISYTTRQPRSNEVNGKDYYFVSRLEFEKLIQKCDAVAKRFESQKMAQQQQMMEQQKEITDKANAFCVRYNNLRNNPCGFCSDENGPQKLMEESII